MITSNSLPSPLQRLHGQGFKPSVKRAIPFLSLYRTAASEEAQAALESPRETVRLEKDGQSVTLTSVDSADVLASVVEGQAKLSGLAKMRPQDQENLLRSLKPHTPESRIENLKRVADNFIAPGEWMGQLAQLQARPNADLVDERTEGLNGRIPKYEELAQLDSEAESLDIDFGYLTDGCYARGHLKCDVLRQDGINRQKLFVEGPLTVRNGKVGMDGTRRDQHWSYHTAPLVMVENDQGQVEPRIWDKTLAKFRGDSMAWYTPQDWVESFDSGADMKIRVTDDSEYVPDRWLQGSFEKNLREAKADVETHNLLAQAERFKLETIGPMMARMQHGKTQ